MSEQNKIIKYSLESEELKGGAEAQGLDGIGQKLSPGFQTTFFGCLADPKSWFLNFCCPCLGLASMEASLQDREPTYFDALCCGNAYQHRQQIRKNNGMEMNEAVDCFAVLCCKTCVIDQNRREHEQRSGKKAPAMPEFKK